MKKNVLALSIATMVGGLGFMGAANAELKVNESGAGHILVVPYFSAQNGNMSVFHVTNTDMVNGKAVKVRFRGASNSDDVLDFQVFLSPGDVWTAAVTKNAEGVAQLVTADNSCTVPRITPRVPVAFVTDRLNPSLDAAQKAEQTLEGYVEILAMSDIRRTSALYNTIKHVNGVAPCNTTILNSTLDQKVINQLGNDFIKLDATDPASVTRSNADLLPPTGGLLGQWYVMNVEKTTTFSGVTPAIIADTDTRNVFSPQKTGRAALETADPLMVAGLIAAEHYDLPDLSTPYEKSTTSAAQQATELTKALLTGSVQNQFATDAGVSGKTDWVFSMPTRRYTIAANYAAPVSSATNAVELTDKGATSLVPVKLQGPTTAYRVINANVEGNAFSDSTKSSVSTAGLICLEGAGSSFMDREEREPEVQSEEPVFSPRTPKGESKFSLCGEVSVLAFSEDESALGAKLTRQNIKVPYSNGWGSMGFGGLVPVLGSAFIKLSNPAATPGTSGTYGLTWAHAK